MDDFHDMLADDALADDALVRRVEEVRQRLVDALVEHDELECRICPELESVYQKKVGAHEYELFEAQLQLEQAKRRVQLVKESLAGGVVPSLPRIEHRMREEMADELQNLNDRHAFLALMQSATRMSDDEEAELGRLYRICLERLHPDLHPRYPERARNLFLYARNVYTRGDLRKMEGYVILSREPFSAHLPRYSAREAADQVALWELQIEFARADIDETKANHPYSERDFLEDDALVEQAVANLDELVREFREECSWYEMECRALLGS